MNSVSRGPLKGTNPTTKRCSRCDAKLYVADRGFGSTAWACPKHGFDRQIVREQP